MLNMAHWCIFHYSDHQWKHEMKCIASQQHSSHGLNRIELENVFISKIQQLVQRFTTV